jgi:potassium-transporting ATPase KdpC subunit
MVRVLIQVLKNGLIFLVIMVILTGVIYPLVITGIARLIFPEQSGGSLIYRDGGCVGSGLIGQPFSDPKYFWGRLSATVDYPYNAAASGATNYGPDNPNLIESVQSRLEMLKKFDPDNKSPVPVDLVTSSASGLDPDISIAAAMYQVSRIARYRNISSENLKYLVIKNEEGRQFGFLGEPRINVLKLNMALDEVFK